MNVGPRLSALALLTLLCQPIAHAGQTDEPVELRVGSKTFTESVILGEMIRVLVKAAGTQAYHQRQLGGSRVLWNALLAGEIDVYPE